MKHICQECGKEFVTKKSTSKYCSRECCDKALARQKRANKPEYHCEVCGAKVEIRGKPRGEHIYCGKKCYGIALAEKNKLKRRRTCVVCGKEFDPSSVVAYCDNSKFTGKTYGDLGMSLRTLGEPRKHWFNLLTNEHLTDIEDESGLIEAGALEIYDSGASIYFWTKN